MRRIVLDASIAMAWCYEDEKNDLADRAFEFLAGSKAVVPSLWAVEVVNAVASGERRQRATEAESARFFGLIEALPIDIDEQTASRAFGSTIGLARRHKLTAYDAAYLELAIREGLMLATLDSKLKAAAEQVGVPLFV